MCVFDVFDVEVCWYGVIEIGLLVFNYNVVVCVLY